MKVALMNADSDFDPGAPEPELSDDLVHDLQLDVVWDAMADGDSLVRAVARAAMLRPLREVGAILYRQAALEDYVNHPGEVAALDAIARDALNLQRSILMMPARGRPEVELARAVRALTELADQFDRLRNLCPTLPTSFASPAFRGLFTTVARELDDDYMRGLRSILHDLSFPDGVQMGGTLGRDGSVQAPFLRRPRQHKRRLLRRTPLERPAHTFQIPERDEASNRALADLRDLGVAEVAEAAARSVEDVLSWFQTLREELAFYRGCSTLASSLRACGVALCVPNPDTDVATTAEGLCDPSLALRTGEAPVGNTVRLNMGQVLVMTGANRGGKSTLLRALGVAQILMQSGALVPATAFSAALVGRVFTHWTREEDEELRHGKLDEELGRMDAIVERIRPGDLLLCNESFASTNEAEGSQIFFDITSALADAQVGVRVVTHMFSYARALQDAPTLDVAFLRAGRAADRSRSFVLTPGVPLRTSHGADLYDRAFGTSLAGAE